jgi:hypothetical protein
MACVLPLHYWKRGLGKQERATQIHGNNLILLPDGHFINRECVINCSAVHYEIEAAKALNNELHSFEDGLSIAHIAQQKLDDDFFPGMFWRQAMPPGESTYTLQLGAIIKHIGAANPGDFVAHHLSGICQELFQMQGVGSIVHEVALPGNRSLLEWFWPHRSRSEFDMLLVRPDVMEIAEASCRAANKAAAFGLEHAKHAL